MVLLLEVVLKLFQLAHTDTAVNTQEVMSTILYHCETFVTWQPDEVTCVKLICLIQDETKSFTEWNL